MLDRVILSAALVTILLGGCRDRAREVAPSASPESDAVVERCDPTRPSSLAVELSPGGTPEVGPLEVLANRCRVRIIDVREPEELAGPLGVIDGAESIPKRHALIEAHAWQRDAPVVFVCRSGRRSGAVAKALAAQGFSHVSSMTGGMIAWNERGLPVGAPRLRETPPQPAVSTSMREVTRADVVRHVADVDQVRWTKAATLMLHGSQACVDGRDAHAIVGTPGGDAGELILALASVESITGRPLSDTDVERLFDAYLEAFGHFYLHTDGHALASLLDAVAADHPETEIPDADDRGKALAFVRNPPVELRASLEQHLVEPNAVGCGHLRLMLREPERYEVRPGLTAAVLRMFFRRLWARDPAPEYVVLEGGHAESAVVSVGLDVQEVHAYTRIPLLSPRIEDTEVFVSHPQVARFIRRENVAFLLEELPLLGELGVDGQTFYETLDRLAARQLAATLEALAPELPHYRVEFSKDAFEVVGPLP